MTAKELAQAIDPNAKRYGRNWRVRCVAHKENEPSLDIAESRSGGVMFVCRGGCEQRDIIAALDALGLWESKPSDETPAERRKREQLLATARRWREGMLHWHTTIVEQATAELNADLERDEDPSEELAAKLYTSTRAIATLRNASETTLIAEYRRGLDQDVGLAKRAVRWTLTRDHYIKTTLKPVVQMLFASASLWNKFSNSDPSGAGILWPKVDQFMRRHPDQIKTFGLNVVSDAPMCSECRSMMTWTKMTWSGPCYECENCGGTSSWNQKNNKKAPQNCSTGPQVNTR